MNNIFLNNQNDIESAKITNAICIAVPKTNGHYASEIILFLYLYDIDAKKQYVINMAHPDYKPWAEPFQPDLSRINLYSPTKKLIVSNYIITKILIDLNFIIYPVKHKIYSLDDFIQKRFYQHKARYKSYTVYPIVSLVEMCRNAADFLLDEIYKVKNYIPDIKEFDDLYYNSLFILEKNRINFDSKIIHSDYNPYTITNRPTNSSYGINLSALSKKDDTRTKLKSSFPTGKLVQFDYASFHLYLLTKMLKFDVPTGEDAYLALNEQYNFSSATTRNEVKMDFFSYLYGYKEFKNDLAFQIDEFKEKLYNYYINNGHVESFFLKRKILFNIPDSIQSNKLFNYFLQNAETEYNFLKITELNELLRKKESKIILYTYDSFLVDIPKYEAHVIGEIQGILESDQIPVNIQIGSNYALLQDIY